MASLPVLPLLPAPLLPLLPLLVELPLLLLPPLAHCPSLQLWPSGQTTPAQAQLPQAPVSGSQQPLPGHEVGEHRLVTQVGGDFDRSHAWPAAQAGEQVAAHIPSTHACPLGQGTSAQEPKQTPLV